MSKRDQVHGQVVRITSATIGSVRYFNTAIADPSRAIAAVSSVHATAGDITNIFKPFSPLAVAGFKLWPGEVRYRH